MSDISRLTAPTLVASPHRSWSGFGIQIGLGMTGLILIFTALALVVGYAFPTSNQLTFPVVDYVHSRHQIYLVDADRGLTAVIHTTNAKIQWGPIWSPDGSLLAYQQVYNGRNEIYVMNADGSGVRQLTHDFVELNSAFAWSPDGTQIVYIALGGHKIYAVDVREGKSVLLIERPRDRVQWPMWSPDGRQIAFVSSDTRGQGSFYLMDKNRYNLRQIGSTSISRMELSPAWSPDGQTIAYNLLDSTAGDIYSVSIISGQIQPLTISMNVYSGPVWSPDSRHLAFWSVEQGGMKLYSMNADGNSLTPLTYLPHTIWAGLEWSGNGHYIAFAAIDGLSKKIGFYYVDADGSNIHHVLDAANNYPLMPVWRP
jgi:TolB protein